MAWAIHPGVDEFVSSSRAFLEGAEEENGVLLGALAALQIKPPATMPFLAEWKTDGQITGVAFQHAGNLVVSRCEENPWAELAGRLLEAERDLPGVFGPASPSEAMAAAWSKARGCEAFLSMDNRLYRLAKVSRPSIIPGRARPAGKEEIELVSVWHQAFDREAAPAEVRPLEELREWALARITSKMLYLWEAENTPVAMASLTRPSRRGIAVNSVYTPPEHRRNGYATALVAEVSAEGLRRGKEFCVLYADRTNSTANSIYQKVGYRPLGDAKEYRFR